MTITESEALRAGSFEAPLAPAQRPQTAPHLSVVAVSRNDDHGGDLRGRMQHFVDGFIAQCRKHGLNAELILVEWNPPPERPPLEDALNWPVDFGPASVRIVTVPPSLHAALPHSAALPLFQMIGKNVGIRRARGRFVLASNIDILFDDATVRYLRDRLRPGTMLRADRYDVPGDLANNEPFDRVLAECRGRWFQVNTRLGTLDAHRRRLVGRDDGGLATRLLALYCEAQVFGWSESIGRASERFLHRVQTGCDVLTALRPQVTPGMLARGAEVALIAVRHAYDRLRREVGKIPDGTLKRKMRRVVPQKAASLLRRFSKAWELIGPTNMMRRSPVERRLANMRRLHTNGCGDFTLLTRDDWFRLRGYPEWPIFSWHVDSVLMFAASANDIPQVTLDARHRIYHIDHSTGSGWSHDGAAQLFARLDRNGVPYISNDFVLAKQLQFGENPESAIVNREDWGLVAHALAEREIVPAASHAAGAMRGRGAFPQPLPAMSLQARR